MQRAEITCAVVLLILAGVVAREGIRLDIGWGDIGPKGGFFPFWLAILLGLSSLTVLFQALRKGKKSNQEPFLPRERIGMLLTVLIPIALVVPLIETVGFYVTALLYLSLYIWWTGKKQWWVNLSISVLFPLAIYFIFEKWFLIPLPKGIVEPYLPF